MKRWFSTVIKDYLTFTKRERIGITVLVISGVLIYFSPKLFSKQEKQTDKNAFAQELAQLQISIDSTAQRRKYANNYSDENDAGNEYYRPKSYPSSNVTRGVLFNFDPNTIDASGWKRLGLRDKTIATIQKFTSKGFKFRKPEDIKRIYGLHEDEANRLIPYIQIENAEGNSRFQATSYTASSSSAASSTVIKPVYKPKVIDVNDADTTAFIALPGIGSKLAARIVNFRDKLGGFFTTEQVAETYGLPDSTFQKIKPLLQCTPANVKALNINELEAADLKNHPYIKWNIANAIVNYRKQHGNYQTVSDLKNINLISDEIFEKIAPYLKTTN